MASRPESPVPLASSWRADAASTCAFVERFFDALSASGVEAVCVSPGSRSTPLALAAHGTVGLATTVHLDERAAAFFALGRARASRRPVALVCTSGTAAANYLPAIVEAHHSGVPLLVFTADRPPELRDWGAGQTIEQFGLYGRYVRECIEVPIPEPGAEALRFAERLAARAVASAWRSPRGPVHLNFPFREPLEPPARHRRVAAATATPLWFDPASRAPLESEVERLVASVRAHARGLVCAGSLDQTEEEAAAIARFSARAGWPVLADPLSQLRCDAHAGSAAIVTTSEFLLRSPAFADAARADVVLRLGGAPVSKAQRLWLATHPPDSLWLVDEQGRFEEPGHLVTEHVAVLPAALLGCAADRLEAQGFEAAPGQSERVDAEAGGGRGSEATNRVAWTQAWLEAERVAVEVLAEMPPDRDQRLREADVVRVLSECVPGGALVLLSNSMPIRDADAFWRVRPAACRFVGNRGANGIDGINSTALGLAAGSGGAPVVSLLGDLTLLHDLGGLLAASEIVGSLTHVVLDNDGGGIFDFLPVASRAGAGDFERLFTTPHGRDLRVLGDFFDMRLEQVGDAEALRKVLAAAIGRPGVTLVHVPTRREVDQAHFRAASAAVVSAADALAGKFAS